MENEDFLKNSSFEEFIVVFPKTNSFYDMFDAEKCEKMVELTEHCIKFHKTIKDSQSKISYLIEEEKTMFDKFYLQTACQHINLDTVRFLLEKGTDPSEPVGDFLPLHVAVVRYGSIPRFLGERFVKEEEEEVIEIIEMLLRSGANFYFSHLFRSRSDVVNEIKNIFINKNILEIIEKNESFFTEEQRKSWHEIRMYKIL